MGFTVEVPVVGTNAGDLIVNVPSSAGDVTLKWASGVDVVVGRGASDTDITFIALRDADGAQHKVYIASGAVTCTDGAL